MKLTEEQKQLYEHVQNAGVLGWRLNDALDTYPQDKFEAFSTNMKVLIKMGAVSFLDHSMLFFVTARLLDLMCPNCGKETIFKQVTGPGDTILSIQCTMCNHEFQLEIKNAQ